MDDFGVEGTVVRLDRPRRVNYYVKNLFVDGNGNFAGALQALVGLGDPQIVSHSVVNVVSNHLWTGLVIQEFIVSKIWFIFSLVVLMVSQTLLPEYRESKEARIATLFCRAITYMLTLLVLLIQHARDTFKAYYGRDTVRVLRLPVPRYLTQFYHIVPQLQVHDLTAVTHGKSAAGTSSNLSSLALGVGHILFIEPKKP